MSREIEAGPVPEPKPGVVDGAKCDVGTGRMVPGPEGIFAKIPGLGTMFKRSRSWCASVE